MPPDGWRQPPSRWCHPIRPHRPCQRCGAPAPGRKAGRTAGKFPVRPAPPPLRRQKRAFGKQWKVPLRRRNPCRPRRHFLPGTDIPPGRVFPCGGPCFFRKGGPPAGRFFPPVSEDRAPGGRAARRSPTRDTPRGYMRNTPPGYFLDTPRGYPPTLGRSAAKGGPAPPARSGRCAPP